MIRRLTMFLFALVAGHITIILLITFVQEVLFGGVSYHKTPLPELLVAGALTSASAVVGGAVAAWIFGKPWFPPAIAMCGLVVLETIFLIRTGVVDGPLWFDVMAAGSLLVGILLGAYIVQRWKQVDLLLAQVS